MVNDNICEYWGKNKEKEIGFVFQLKMNLLKTYISFVLEGNIYYLFTWKSGFIIYHTWEYNTKDYEKEYYDLFFRHFAFIWQC